MIIKIIKPVKAAVGSGDTTKHSIDSMLTRTSSDDLWVSFYSSILLQEDYLMLTG